MGKDQETEKASAFASPQFREAHQFMGGDALNEDEMIATMRRYSQKRHELEARKERGRRYLEQVKFEVEESLRPLAEEVEAARGSMQVFVSEHNSGESFNVPGLGTAFLTHTAKVEITDEAEVGDYLNTKVHENVLTYLTDPAKLNASKVKRYAKERLVSSGEVLPGTRSEVAVSLVFRSSGSPPTGAADPEGAG